MGLLPSQQPYPESGKEGFSSAIKRVILEHLHQKKNLFGATPAVCPAKEPSHV